MENKHLDARGKGKYTYDFRNDILLFKIMNRDYSHSVDFGNMVVDIDKEGFITGLRIIDASKFINTTKIALKNVKNFRFDTSAKNNVITIKLKFMSMIRNKPKIIQGQDFIREAQDIKIKDSEVLCTIPPHI